MFDSIYIEEKNIKRFFNDFNESNIIDDLEKIFVKANSSLGIVYYSIWKYLEDKNQNLPFYEKYRLLFNGTGSAMPEDAEQYLINAMSKDIKDMKTEFDREVCEIISQER